MSFFGINGAEFIVLVIVAVILLGPGRAAQAIVWLQAGIEKLREWSAQLREQTAQLRQDSGMSDAAQAASEVNSAISALDPANLDPRKMIKAAVAEEMQLWLKEANLDQFGKPQASKLKPKDS